jgi:hypothetical protein
MNLRWLAVALLVLSPGSITAKAASGCGQFAAYIEHVTVNTTRSADSGSTPGDRRFGNALLVDDAQQKIGVVYFDATVVLTDAEAGATLLGNLYYTLGEGSLAGQYLLQIPDHSQPHTLGAEEAVYPISAGTGVYHGATGSVRASTTADGRRSFQFDISC